MQDLLKLISVEEKNYTVPEIIELVKKAYNLRVTPPTSYSEKGAQTKEMKDYDSLKKMITTGLKEMPVEQEGITENVWEYSKKNSLKERKTQIEHEYVYRLLNSVIQDKLIKYVIKHQKRDNKDNKSQFGEEVAIYQNRMTNYLTEVETAREEGTGEYAPELYRDDWEDYSRVSDEEIEERYKGIVMDTVLRCFNYIVESNMKIEIDKELLKNDIALNKTAESNLRNIAVWQASERLNTHRYFKYKDEKRNKEAGYITSDEIAQKLASAIKSRKSDNTKK